MTAGIALAIVLGVLASGCFALGATMQHGAVDDSFEADAQSRSLTGGRLWRMVKNKWWLLGTLIIGVGALLHLVGVSMAPITVIQPVGILAVPFSVLLAARKTGTKPTGGMWRAIAFAVVGIIGFTYFSAKSAETETQIVFPRIIIASLIIWACAAVFSAIGSKGPYALRCLNWACAGAFIYGLATALMKTMLTVMTHTDRVLTHLPFWLSLAGVLVCYAVGGFLIQQAYASGPAEIVVGCMTVVDPLIAVVFGITVLGEGAKIGVSEAIGMVVMAAIASTGVFLLSKHHPDAAKAYENLDRPAHHEQEGSPR